MKTIIFSFIILLSSICYGQNHIVSNDIVVVVRNKNKCNLSRAAERYFNNPQVRSQLREKSYQMVAYLGQDVGREWLQKWRIKWYPTVIHLRKIDQQWYVIETYVPANDTNGNRLWLDLNTFLGISTENQPTSPYNDPLIPGSNSPSS